MPILRAAPLFFIALCVVLHAPASVSAQADDSPSKAKIALVVGKGKGAPQLKGPVKKLIEKQLKASVEVINFKKFQKAARKAKVKKKEFTSAQSATEVGAAIGATHIVIVESQMQQEVVDGKKRKFFFAAVSVVDVQSGDVVHAQPYALKGRKLTSDIAGTIVGDVTAKLIVAAAEQPVPQDAPAEEPVAEAPPPPPEAPAAPEGDTSGEAAVVADGTEASDPTALGGMVDEGGTGDSAALGGMVDEADTDSQALGGMVDEGDAAEASTTESDPAFGGALSTFVEEPEASTTRTAPSARAKNARWRPALRLRIGGMGLQRNGTMESSVEGVDPPCYCGEEGESNPFFPALALSFEFYPGSLAAVSGKGKLWEGLGIHFEAMPLTQVKTVVDPASDESVTSNVFGLAGGLSFRYVLWDALTAADATLDLGASYFHFPLRVGVFPGVKYFAPYAGLRFAVPLGTPMASLLAGARYSPAVSASGKTKRLGEQDGGTSLRADVGVRLAFLPFEVDLIFRWEQVNTKYTGRTTLNAATEFDDVSLNDRFMILLPMPGLAF